MLRLPSGEGHKITFSDDDQQVGGDPVPVKVLPIVRKPQGAENWCWAACAQMVVKHLNQADVEQYDVVNKLLGRSDCDVGANAVDRSKCNKTCTVADLPRVYEPYHIKCDHNPGNVAQIDMQGVVTEIKAERPVEVGLFWTDSSGNVIGGHVVLVVGYGHDDWLYVHDTRLGFDSQPYVRYSYLQTAYGLGKWAHTWAALRKEEP